MQFVANLSSHYDYLYKGTATTLGKIETGLRKIHELKTDPYILRAVSRIAILIIQHSEQVRFIKLMTVLSTMVMHDLYDLLTIPLTLSHYFDKTVNAFTIKRNQLLDSLVNKIFNHIILTPFNSLDSNEQSWVPDQVLQEESVHIEEQIQKQPAQVQKILESALQKYLEQQKWSNKTKQTLLSALPSALKGSRDKVLTEVVQSTLLPNIHFEGSKLSGRKAGLILDVFRKTIKKVTDPKTIKAHIRQAVEGHLNTFFNHMQNEMLGYRTKEEFLQALQSHMNKQEISYLEVKVPLNTISLLDLDVSASISFLNAMEVVFSTLFRLGCLPFYLQELHLCDLSKVAQSIGQSKIYGYAIFSWIAEQRLENWAGNCLYLAFGCKIVESTRRLFYDWYHQNQLSKVDRRKAMLDIAGSILTITFSEVIRRRYGISSIYLWGLLAESVGLVSAVYSKLS